MVLKHYLNRSIFNNLKNFWLQYKNKKRQSKEIISFNVATPPLNYELVFEDDFNDDKLNREKWSISQPWGEFHPKQLWWYWPKNQTCVKVSKKEGLKLLVRNIPRTFLKYELPQWRQTSDLPNQWVSPTAAGLIISKPAFTYGWIESIIKLPTEHNQWSAFWTAGKNSWPPEIDIFEAYTKEDVNNIDVQPNLHWNLKNKTGRTDYGAPNIYLKYPNKRFIHYAVHWTEDFIRIYYDGLLVQEMKNKQSLIDNGNPQNIILNHGVKSCDYEHIESEMVVRVLRVYQDPKNPKHTIV